jgi:hypothetical protein
MDMAIPLSTAGLFAELIQLHLGNSDPTTLLERHAPEPADRALPGIFDCVGSGSVESRPAFSL